MTGGVYLPATVRTSRPLPLSMIGRDVSLSIAAAHSDGPVLAVPGGRHLRPRGRPPVRDKADRDRHPVSRCRCASW